MRQIPVDKIVAHKAAVTKIQGKGRGKMPSGLYFSSPTHPCDESDMQPSPHLHVATVVVKLRIRTPRGGQGIPFVDSGHKSRCIGACLVGDDEDRHTRPTAKKGYTLSVVVR